MAGISQIAHTCIGVSDLGRALEFYAGALGLEIERRTEMPNGAVLVLLKCPCGDEVIELYWNDQLKSPVGTTGPGAVPSPSVGQRHVAFWVDDVRQVVADLEAKGVVIARRPPAPGQPGSMLVFIKDPDGTDIELMQQA